LYFIRERRIHGAEDEKPRKLQMAISDLLEGAVLKMLAKRPGQRYQTVGDPAKDLERVAMFQGVTV
jgi:hypothetical protein